MSVQEIYAALLENATAYKEMHARTADCDFRIMEALASGKNPIQTSMEIPCDISSVYRAKDRVLYFLENENDAYDDVRSNTVTMSHSIARGRSSLKSVTALKFSRLCFARHQKGYNCIENEIVLRFIPGMRNQKERNRVLKELNNYVVITDEQPPVHLKIFEYVLYNEGEYSFELTEQAYPYFYPLYTLLGRHPTFENLFR